MRYRRHKFHKIDHKRVCKRVREKIDLALKVRNKAHTLSKFILIECVLIIAIRYLYITFQLHSFIQTIYFSKYTNNHYFVFSANLAKLFSPKKLAMISYYKNLIKSRILCLLIQILYFFIGKSYFASPITSLKNLLLCGCRRQQCSK